MMESKDMDIVEYRSDNEVNLFELFSPLCQWWLGVKLFGALKAPPYTPLSLSLSLRMIDDMMMRLKMGWRSGIRLVFNHGESAVK